MMPFRQDVIGNGLPEVVLAAITKIRARCGLEVLFYATLDSASIITDEVFREHETP
jgi:hypothetical protein